MTTVTVVCNSKGIIAIRASGHADYAQFSHEDIVCAGISVLMTTCANALQSVCGIKPIVKVDSRTAVIMISLPEHLSDKIFADAQIVIRTVLQGLNDISEQYPSNLRISDNGGKKHVEA